MTRHCGVSFLRHREIYPDADLIIGLGSCTATPRTHRNEFQPAIPRRVALLHCSLPLRQPHSFCTLKPNPSSYNQRAVTCPEFACLSPRAHSRLYCPLYPEFSPSAYTTASRSPIIIPIAAPVNSPVLNRLFPFSNDQPICSTGLICAEKPIPLLTSQKANANTVIPRRLVLTSGKVLCIPTKVSAGTNNAPMSAASAASASFKRGFES
jgi:hypothetical protein